MCVGGVVIEVSDAVNGRRRISVAEKRAGGGLGSLQRHCGVG